MTTEYGLADLARMADVTPRTIRYYVAQGLLPSPDAAGPATRYSAGHLARLRLIRRLQRDHLPLAEIRERLEQMTDADVVSSLAAMGSQPPPQRVTGIPDEAVGYVRDLMEEARIEPNIHPAPEPDALRRSGPMARPGPTLALRSSVSLVSGALPQSAPPAVAVRPVPAESPPLSRPSRSTWERLAITPDIEIHVRRPLKPLDNKRADHLERYARELFQDEP